MSVPHVFGIRHHGPGSARSLRQALDALAPNVVLVEGPPDADDILPLAPHEQMTPPVAILVYQSDTPRRCVYYPFAIFSPEWQAIQWALQHQVPVRFMDLPQSIQLAIDAEEETAIEAGATDADEDEPDDEGAPLPSEERAGQGEGPTVRVDLRRDPLRALAEAAGYGDGERWWDHMVEQRSDGAGVFEAILEAMTALRNTIDPHSMTGPPLPNEEEAGLGEGPGARGEARREALREAFMRQTIRAAQREGRQRIAVVCGAWHAPVLADPRSLSSGGGAGGGKADKALLDGLPKVKTTATWIPWTNGRLSYHSGYGAGIESPGWYEHLWTRQGDVVIPWMIRVAHLLREQDLDASPASVIEAIRLAECLASVRGRPLPGLPELNEAIMTVLCFGSDVPMRLIAEKLIVGDQLGRVPDDAPSVPLLQDLNRQQKRLRLPPETGQRTIDLDQRKQTDLERSELLHRLVLLGVPWGRIERSGGGKGTFHELWRLQWKPEFAILVIEKGAWGNSIADASSAYAANRANAAEALPDVTRLLELVMLARLPDAIARLMERLDDVAAHAGDITHLMAALPPMVNVSRYGDVRGTDTAMVTHAIDGLVVRICVGIAPACSSLDDDAAAKMSGHIAEANSALILLQHDGHLADWRDGLQRMSESTSLHGLIGGQCTRILLDAGALDASTAGRRMGLAISTAADPAQAAAWVEGFLMGSGMLLVHDEALWNILDAWVSALNEEQFTALVPLLRRTFSKFPSPERRMLGERAKAGRSTARVAVDDDIDHERAALALPAVLRYLGVES